MVDDGSCHGAVAPRSYRRPRPGLQQVADSNRYNSLRDSGTFTAEDVKFSFHRYRGVSAKTLHDRVREVLVVDPHRVRFILHAPWPDFLAFYASPATGAA